VSFPLKGIIEKGERNRTKIGADKMHNKEWQL
jgi:hypothetical protein